MQPPWQSLPQQRPLALPLGTEGYVRSFRGVFTGQWPFPRGPGVRGGSVSVGTWSKRDVCGFRVTVGGGCAGPLGGRVDSV